MKKLLLIAIALMLGSPAYAQKFQADSQINVTSIIITATNTPTVVTARPATVYSLDLGSSTTTPLFVKLYNAISLAACGTGVPQARYTIPGAISGTNSTAVNTNGDGYSAGIVVCIVTNISDGNTTAPPAGAGLLNIHWKQSVSP